MLPPCPDAGMRIFVTRRRPILLALLLITVLGLLELLVLASPSAAQVPAGWKLVAQDSFARTSATWGAADSGGRYTVNGAGGTKDGQGTTTLRAGTTFEASLNGLSLADVDLSDTVAVGQGSAGAFHVMTGWVARRQTDGSQYNAALWVNQDGRATLGLTRVNGKVNTWLGGTLLPVPIAPGQTVRGQLQVVGTSPVHVRARVWALGAQEPGWQTEHEDASSTRISAAGGVGVRNYLATASEAVTATHDDLEVAVPDLTMPSASPSPTPAPTPPTTKPRPPRGTTLGSQSFPVPGDALFVDGTHGLDSNAGTQSAPMKTVRAAVAKATPGRTIVLRAGTYHESVTSPKRMTIQNYPGETVWFDGSVAVNGWQKSGTSWVHSGWKAEFDASMGGAATKARYVNTASPMAADPDQVFVDGVPLKQVASAAQVTPGTFAVNDSADTITIGTDPTSRSVRASDLPMAFALSGGATIQGIGVRRYATPHDVGAAVRLSSPGGTLRHLVITDNAMQGVALSNVDKVVDRLVVTNNGQLGVGGTELDRTVVQNSVINGNNAENFNNEPVSGGVKITRSRGIKTINNEVSNNLSAGIWFDASSYQIVAVNNDLADNRSTQLELEVSAQGIVANNTVTGGTTGILIHDTSDVSIYNNKLGDHSIFGIKISQDKRRQADPSVPEAHDKRRPIPDPTVTWVTERITISNNVFGNSNGRGGFQIYALDGETNRPADAMAITIDGNLFVKRIKKLTTEPTMVAWGQADNHTLVRYETPEELHAKNAGWENAQAPDTYRIAAMDPFITQYASVAKPLPAEVAQEAGLSAGARQLGIY